MKVDVKLNITPFGQIKFEIGKHIYPAEYPPTAPGKELVRYVVPRETVASQRYTIRYDEAPLNYIVPRTTG